MKKYFTLILLVILALAAAGVVFAQDEADKMEDEKAEITNFAMNEETQEGVNTNDDEVAPGDASAPVEANEVN